MKALIGGNEEKHHDPSILSSVEILYIDRATAIVMQNWHHLVQVIKYMNHMPKAEVLSNSFDQFRPLFLDLKGKIYRQSIVFS